MSEKKRKRTSETGDRPAKKVAVDAPPSVVKVSVVASSDELAPVIASTPGLSLPAKTSFQAYRKTQCNGSVRSGSNRPGNTSELLLHSSTHSKIDYTGREEAEGGSDGILKHYVGVYDPKTGELQVMPARKLVVRASVRQDDTTAVEDTGGENGTDAAPKLSSRTALGLSFGTKKSQKAIRALTENAISPHKPRNGTTATASQSSSQPLDPLAAAVVDSMAGTTSTMPTREDLQSAVEDAKPRPKPNLEATTPSEVYSVSDLVGGEETLRLLVVRDWQDAVAANKPIHTTSRFVSKRLANLAQSGEVKRLKTLRYLLILLEFYGSLKSGPKGIKKVPQREELRKAMGNGNEGMTEGVRRKFADSNALNKWHTDNLLTHITALALTIDHFDLDLFDLREDLKLDQKTMTQYARELGCKVSALTESERSKMGLTKTEAAAHRMARLRLPLEFPKNRVQKAARR